MPEEMEKVIREMPRDAEVIELLKSSPAPIRCRRGEAKEQVLFSDCLCG